jgi:hypothetical protein
VEEKVMLLAGIVPASPPPRTPEPSDEEDCEEFAGQEALAVEFAAGTGAQERGRGARAREPRQGEEGGEEGDDGMAGGFVAAEDDDDAGSGGFLPPGKGGAGCGQPHGAGHLGAPHDSVLRKGVDDVRVSMGVGHALAVPMVAQPPSIRCPEWRMVPVGGMVPADGHDESASARGDRGGRERHGGRGGEAGARTRTSAETAGRAGETEETARCRECGEANYQPQFSETFGVLVCKTCCAADEKYKLITKTTAKEELLVTDEDLKPLGFISRKNPRKEAWGEMKLFLRLQVEEVAFHRYGDLVGVEAQKFKRQMDKYERLKRKKPTGSVLRGGEEGDEKSPSSACLSDGSRGLASSAKALPDRPQKKKKKEKEQIPPLRPMPAARHIHVWGEEWYDEAKETWRHKCVECSCTASFERL